MSDLVTLVRAKVSYGTTETNSNISIHTEQNEQKKFFLNDKYLEQKRSATIRC